MVDIIRFIRPEKSRTNGAVYGIKNLVMAFFAFPPISNGILIMPRIASYILAVLLAFMANGASGEFQESDFPMKLHPWGGFEPGVWKLVRVTTQSLDERGQVVGSGLADTRTTLAQIDKNGVKLEVDACMEVAGKRFQGDPQTIEQSFYGEPTTLNSTVKPVAEGEVVIEDRKIPCKVQQVEAVGPSGKTTVTIYYSPSVAPYVLKRESVTMDADGKTVASETKTEIVAFAMPIRVRQETRSGTYVKTVQKTAKSTTTTLAVVLPDVTGGVVHHSMKEEDATGRVVRRSTLELLDYDADADHLLRKRPPRRTKTPSH
jgi:hypothetical protein